jgi:Flp pilus assembly pilin Flp
MATVIAVLVAVVFVGAIAVARRYRNDIRSVWKPGLALWRIGRLVAVGLIAYGLFVSGRAFMQVIGLIVVAFFGFYLVLEEPLEHITDSNAE